MRVPREGYESMLPLARQGFLTLQSTVRPRKVWQRLPLCVNGHDIAIAGEVLCTSASLARLFADCHSCVVLAVTLGPQVDRQIQTLARQCLESALACDACASVWADSLCDEVVDEIEQTLADGEYQTKRFSPGYGDVPMALTSDLLRLLDAERRIGLTLSIKGMMIPVKSVTALIGISSQTESHRRTCADCALAECPYRTNGGTCQDE